MILDALIDAIVDTARLLPFLFVTYLLMEYLEHFSEEKTEKWLKGAGRLGPAIGAAAGVLPQCGFSAAAASLFSGGIISVGTLLAVFLSTSDEMLPIFISEQVAPGRLGKILLLKAAVGAITGFFIDFLVNKLHPRINSKKRIRDLCEREHCGCEDDEDEEAEAESAAGGHSHENHGHGFLHIAKPALSHTLQISLFIFIITTAITLLVEGIGEEAIGSFLSGEPVLGVFMAALIGLIPNCAASVALTELFLKGMLSAAQMIAGLLVGAGVGLLVLFRTNDYPNENLVILLMLYASGVVWGLIFEGLGIVL